MGNIKFLIMKKDLENQMNYFVTKNQMNYVTIGQKYLIFYTKKGREIIDDNGNKRIIRPLPSEVHGTKIKPRLELYRRLKYQHQVHLTPNEMDTIEKHFHDNIKGSIFHVGMYRAINFVFTVLILAGIVILWNQHAVVMWFITGMMSLFLIYNIIHLLINVFQYKAVKEPEPFDESIPESETNE